MHGRERSLLDLGILPNQPMPQLTAPVKEIIAYFKGEIGKRDRLIDQLRIELDRLRSSKLIQ